MTKIKMVSGNLYKLNVDISEVLLYINDLLQANKTMLNLPDKSFININQIERIYETTGAGFGL